MSNVIKQDNPNEQVKERRKKALEIYYKRKANEPNFLANKRKYFKNHIKTNRSHVYKTTVYSALKRMSLEHKLEILQFLKSELREYMRELRKSR